MAPHVFHFYSAVFSVYCPAGCKNATGDVWGNSEQGYRDVSTQAFIRPNCSVFILLILLLDKCLGRPLFCASDLSPVQVCRPRRSRVWRRRRSRHCDSREKSYSLRIHLCQRDPLQNVCWFSLCFACEIRVKCVSLTSRWSCSPWQGVVIWEEAAFQPRYETAFMTALKDFYNNKQFLHVLASLPQAHCLFLHSCMCSLELSSQEASVVCVYV